MRWISRNQVTDCLFHLHLSPSHFFSHSSLPLFISSPSQNLHPFHISFLLFPLFSFPSFFLLYSINSLLFASPLILLHCHSSSPLFICSFSHPLPLSSFSLILYSFSLPSSFSPFPFHLVSSHPLSDPFLFHLPSLSCSHLSPLFHPLLPHTHSLSQSLSF